MSGNKLLLVLLVFSTLLTPAGVAIAGDAGDAIGFDYFRNSWSVVGLKDYRHGTRITPDNRLLLDRGVGLQLRVGERLRALSRRQTKTLLEGWLPVVRVETREGSIAYRFTFWATPLPESKNWQAAFNWPTEGEDYANWILIEVTNRAAEPAVAKVRVETSATDLLWSRDITRSLPPGDSAAEVVCVSFAHPEKPLTASLPQARLWLERTCNFWKELILPAARIEVPCRKATEALLAAHVCQLIANDHGQLHGGEGFYDEFYIRDGGYQIMELEEAGLHDAAAKAVEYYLQSQRPDGRFETQSNQFDANGQALWVLWQYYQITGDRQWLAKAYPQMRKAVDWMIRARRQAPDHSPYAGLLPAAPADGEYLWDGKHHIVGYDLWNLRGLLCTADAARDLGRDDEAQSLLAEAAEYRKAIDSAWRRTGLAHFPPSWEKEGTHWGNTETLWPTVLFDPHDPRVAALDRHVRHEHGGGYVEGTILWLGRPGAIHPYMGAYTTMASLVRGEHEQVVEDFYWYLLHSTATHAFPEGIYYQRRFAWSNTIPHVTGASNFALMLRHMLVHEQGDQLHLLLAVPDWWLEPGRRITVRRAPTHFGTVDLTVTGTDQGVRVDWHPQWRNRPAKVVLHLPQSRRLCGQPENVEVSYRSDQTRRWDFATVVAQYQRNAPPLFGRAIPGLVSLPVRPPLTPDRCVMLDLAAVANTDPLRAPFGVENPGKYLFTGLPLGVHTAAGVPFRILDPQENHRRAFVVLHSPKAPKNRQWPREVEVAVGQQGKRLFFLGNVHGWFSQDPGTGPWGAVAEYVICYTDGKKQTVPLITGRTADEWAARPEAEEVCVGFRGNPWHLNVLGVELRNVPVERIIFRDLGTPAAPVLVAVTLEK